MTDFLTIKTFGIIIRLIHDWKTYTYIEMIAVNGRSTG